MGETETVEEEGILLKICDAYRNLGQAPLYITFTLMVIIPMVYPLGLAIGVTQWTRDYKAVLDAMPDGGILAIPTEYTFGGEPTRLPAAVDTINYVIRNKNAKIVTWGAFDPIVTQLQINIFNSVDWAGYGYEYGVDYVMLGYKVGGETWLAAAAADFPGAVKVDYYNTPVSQLPLVMEIQTSADVDVLALMSDWAWETLYGRQWYGVTTGLLSATIISDVLGFYPFLFKGFLDASGAGVAEFEVLTGMPGSAVIGTDILSLGQIYLMIIIILSNLTYWYVRKKRGV